MLDVELLLFPVNKVGDVDEDDAIADVDVADCCCGRILSAFVAFKLRSTLSIELMLSVVGFVDEEGVLDVPGVNVGD